MEKLEWSRIVPAGLAAGLAFFYSDILLRGFGGVLTGRPMLPGAGEAPPAAPGGWGAPALGMALGILQFILIMAGYAAVRPRFRGASGAIAAVSLAVWAFAALQAGPPADGTALILSLFEYPLAVAAGSFAFEVGRRLDL